MLHNTIKTCFFGGNNCLAKAKGLKDVIANHTKDITASINNLLEKIEAPGLNPYKQVETYFKYSAMLPYQHHNNILHKKPSKELIVMMKNEKKSCKDFKSELNKVKLLVERKDNIKSKLEKYTLGVDRGEGERRQRRMRQHLGRRWEARGSKQVKQSRAS